MTDPHQKNRDRWDELAPVHAQLPHYRFDRFIDDPSYLTLREVEVRELGAITGKSILHLQCHVGNDTLSLARMGAEVTGADFSAASIEQARDLARRAGLAATFIVSDIYRLPEKLTKQFDIVFSNWGSLQWLNDVRAWAKLVAGFLKAGGSLYMAEQHPVGLVYAREIIRDQKEGWRYFANEDGSPVRMERKNTYAGGMPDIANSEIFQWPHSLGDILTALADHGLGLEFLHEWPFSEYEQMPGMILQENGMYQRPAHELQVPLTFTLKARKL